MARIRTIKPGFWKHEELSALPEATHMLAAALLNYADDFGYFNANPKLIKSECLPLREPTISIPESLRSLAEINYIRLGTGADGKRYGQIVTFNEHQVVSHPGKSKISAQSIDWGGSIIPPEDSRNIPISLAPEGNKEEEGNKEINLSENLEGEFEEGFWPKYPRKEAKPLGLKAFRKARGKASLDAILAGLERYVKTKPGHQDWAMPASWLNAERWNDQPAQSSGKTSSGQINSSAGVTVANTADFAAQFKIKYAGKTAPNGVYYPPLDQQKAAQ